MPEVRLLLVHKVEEGLDRLPQLPEEIEEGGGAARMKIRGRVNGEIESKDMKIMELERRDLEMSALPWFSINGIQRLSYLPQHRPKEGKIMSFPAKEPLRTEHHFYVKIEGKKEKWLKKVDGTHPTYDYFCHTEPPIFAEVKSKNSPLNENQKKMLERMPFH